MKILMATMGLGIGGAETHIVELCKALRKQGHDVAVASHGGVYVQEIEAAGIRHYEVPMHRRSVVCMLKSLVLLWRAIRTEQPDIVHAHARIPAFLCNLLHKTMHFPFVTTAHWVFDTGGGLKRLTRWGTRTVAVSEDIKLYLMENYGIPAAHIFVTTNGIDTDKFSPKESGERVIAEFGLNPDAPIVSYVSRMDESRALVARQLIAIAPQLQEKIPGIQLLIVGGGDVFEELKAKAETVNRQLDRRCVVMTGPRTDISEVVAAGDLFIGVSRAALEAMAEEKPTLVAGNEGYLGLFSQDKLQAAQENNFCCRSCERSREQKLLEDIIHCLTVLTPEERHALGIEGRQAVLDYYSVNRMASDCLAAYRAVLPRKYHVVMCGYYGFHNAGDEAILQSIHRNIEKASDQISITVLSNDPKDTQTRYGYEAVHRFRFEQVIRALHRCDVLLFGGGSLLQDRTSTRSIVYYLTIIRLAECMGKKVMFYANGIGPVTKPHNRKRVAKAAAKASVITLRDQNSADELRNMGVLRNDLLVTTDPVLTMDCIGTDHSMELLRESGIPTNCPFVGVSIRSWPDMGDFCEKLAACCDALYEKNKRNIVFFIMQNPNDMEISRQVQGLMKNPAYILERNYQPAELMGAIGQSELVIAMRLHTLIFSARTGVPLVGLVYDPKVRYYLELLGMPSAGNVENFSQEELLAQCRKLLHERETYAHALHETVAGLRERERENVDCLLRLLEK